MCGLCDPMRGHAPEAEPSSWSGPRGEVSPLGYNPVSRFSTSRGGNEDSLLVGSKWGDAKGTGVTLEYSFPSGDSRWAGAYGDGEPFVGLAPLNHAQKAAVRDALAQWADVANVRFEQVADNPGNVGDLRFALSSMPPTAWAYFPGRSPEAGDVWLGRALHGGRTDYQEGGYNYQTVLHEIGHALGLRHPHEGGAGNDWLGLTVMSYRSYPGDSLVGGYSNDFYPTSPMLWDVAAIQKLYGANTATRAGDTVYRWDPDERIFETIWDGGGIDTIDWSNQWRAAMINLAAGSWSRLGAPYTWRDAGRSGSTPYTVAIADGVVIENAIGGSGADTIIGNAGRNWLYGNDGDDLLLGLAGRDRLFGGAGDDILIGGKGRDALRGRAGDDTFAFDDGDTGVGPAARDQIFDVGWGDDLIDLSAVDADWGRSGDQAFVWRGTAPFTGPAQLRYCHDGGATLIQGSMDRDGAPELEIELAGSLRPEADWFVL